MGKIENEWVIGVGVNKQEMCAQARIFARDRQCFETTAQETNLINFEHSNLK